MILAVETTPSHRRPLRPWGSRTPWIKAQTYGLRPSRASCTPSRSAAITAIAGCRMKRNVIGPPGRSRMSLHKRPKTLGRNAVPERAADDEADKQPDRQPRLKICASRRRIGQRSRRPAHHAAEADVARGGVDRLGVARGGPVAAAIVRRAQMRAAFQHLAGNADFRLARIVALGLRPAARILRHAARLGASAGWRVDQKSVVHSQTLPIMS